jgi:hypothetical protein
MKDSKTKADESTRLTNTGLRHSCCRARAQTRQFRETFRKIAFCRPGQTFKKPKYLSVCDRDERGRGEGAVCMCEQVA